MRERNRRLATNKAIDAWGETVVFAFMATFGGISLPIGGDPIFSMVLWLVLLAGGTAAFCRFIYLI